LRCAKRTAESHPELVEGAAVPTSAHLSPSVRFRKGSLLLAGAVDVGDDVQVLVELNACSQCTARFPSAVQQAGQLNEAQILEVHDVAAFRWGEGLGFGDRVLGPVEVHASEVGFLRS